MESNNLIHRSSSLVLTPKKNSPVFQKKEAKVKVSNLIQNARRIHEDFKRQLKVMQPNIQAVKLRNEYEKEKLSEESDLNKLLKLKKQEISLNEEYKVLKKDLKERLEDIQTKEDTFKCQAEEIITSINQDELTLIQKCHVKQSRKKKRLAKETGGFERND